MATVRERIRTAADGTEKTYPDGRLFDQHRKRHAKSFVTKKAPTAWLHKTQHEVKNGVQTPERASINVYEAIQLWLERGKAEGLERNTLRAYETFVRLHIGPTIGAAKLATLTSLGLVC